MRQAPAPSFAHDLRKAAALLVSSVTVLSLVSSFPAQPKIFLPQLGIVCATLSALTMFVYFWTIQRGDNIPITEASPSQKAFAVFSVPVSLYAQFSLFHFAARLPHSWVPEIGMLGGVVCSLLVFTYCWAATFAYVMPVLGTRRKLAFPEMTPEQFGRRPPTFFAR